MLKEITLLRTNVQLDGVDQPYGKQARNKGITCTQNVLSYVQKHYIQYVHRLCIGIYNNSH